MQLVLFLSLVEGQAAAVAELISLGCSSQEMDKNGATALHMASQAAVLATGQYMNQSLNMFDR